MRVGLCEVEVDSRFCVLSSTLIPKPSPSKSLNLLNLKWVTVAILEIVTLEWALLGPATSIDGQRPQGDKI